MSLTLFLNLAAISQCKYSINAFENLLETILKENSKSALWMLLIAVEGIHLRREQWVLDRLTGIHYLMLIQCASQIAFRNPFKQLTARH